MKSLSPLQYQYWDQYLKTIPEVDRPFHPFVEASYAGSREVTDALLKLYLAGKKTAGSSIAEDFRSVGDSLPQVGNYWICLKSDGEPGGILRTEKVVMNNFKDVPVEIAVAEGEGDLSLEY